jgi:A/G-specific adenine glycosylase
MVIMTITKFRKLVWNHFRAHGRHTMPWRETRDPYRILVSEIMLQQTQVSRVEKFYPIFVKQFPNFRALAHAKTADVLRAWQGLGYNRRALLLQRLAQAVLKNHAGKLPRDRATLESLPGIGKGTSGSLAAFAWGEPAVFIETNIRRVFIHHFFPNRRKVTDKEIEPLVSRSVDRMSPREWYWALMDYGAMLGETSRSRASENPNIRSKHYARQSAFAGSDRELRGKLLKIFLHGKKIAAATMATSLNESSARVTKIVGGLVREGFLIRKGKYFSIA